MRLITLNIWGGHVLQPLLRFFQCHQDVDVFCLQEVYHRASSMITDEDRTVYLDIFDRLDKALPDHIGYFEPVVNGIYGVAIFIRKELTLLNHGALNIYHNPRYPGLGPAHDRKLQWVEVERSGQSYTVANVHGLWNGEGKKDSEARLLQSGYIQDFIHQLNSPLIMAGDFNLRPDTISLSMISQGLQDLIKDYAIQSTRTVFYPKQERFADYVFVSRALKVSQLAVLPDEVSDHAPLLVEIS